MATGLCRPVAANEKRDTLSCTFCRVALSFDDDDVVTIGLAVFAHETCAAACRSGGLRRR